MLLETGLMITGGLAVVGLLYRAFGWFSLKIGRDAGTVSIISRLYDFGRRLPRTMLSGKFMGRLVLDVLLQARLWKEAPLRWAAHVCMAYGFTALLLLHALDGQITARLFSGYEVTLNPWLVLRNILGLLVIFGVIISLRTHPQSELPIKNRGMDRWALVLLALIMVSGFVLEGAKIISSGAFMEMAEDYAGSDDPEELRPLQAYWTKNHGVRFDGLEGPFDAETMAMGAEMNEESCLSCHVRPQSAFVSYAVSRIMTPLASWLNRTRADVWLWYPHVLICLVGLALLPFTKFLHMLTSPLTLLAPRPSKDEPRSPEYLATTRALALDACTHCGLCSEHCSVAPVFRSIGNGNILPSEKMLGLKALFRGRPLDDREKSALQEGNSICTGCYRCTEVCPVGLNLQDLWTASRDELTARRLPTPAIRARDDGQSRLDEFQRVNSFLVPEGYNGAFRSLMHTDTFRQCFTCQSCSCSCPVVQNYAENAGVELDLLPHQIVRAVALGQPDLALNARMIWDCMNCYTCQEHCPQEVRVCDIMYQLKNMAYARLADNPN